MSDPRDRQIADLLTQLRLLGAQADALRAALEIREDEIVRLSALLIETQDTARKAQAAIQSPSDSPPSQSNAPAPVAPRPRLLARLTRRGG